MNQRIVPAVMAASSLIAAELPVKRVVLYKHGVGYFERSGELTGGESARLDFKASEMNDVLKSLTIEETGGGKVSGLRYDSSTPLDQRLNEYSFSVGSQIPLAQFLDQFKGARIDMDSAGQKPQGAIVSGRTVPATEQQPQRDLLVVLTDANELKTVDLSSVTALKLADPVLQRQLRDYLGALAGARTREQRSVYIDSSDAKSRKVAASYLIPTPIWKSSYRLIFRPNVPQPLLEGWAIIDNTTNDDWTNIGLSLVSGKPISFQSRLYDPKFIERPFADLPEEQAAEPILYAAGIASAPSAAPPPPPAPMAKAAMGGRGRVPLTADAVEVTANRGISNISVQTEGRELGELFEYAFSQPVTVKRNQSAMLPFLQQPLDARRLLIYSDRSTQNPRTAAELTNTTGKTLDGGPITVFDSNAYAGEALVETVKTGDKRLISYGIDLGTRITANIDSGSRRYLEFKAVRGSLIAKTGMEETTTFTIKNVDNRAKTLIIEHPLRPGYKLLNQKPVETTASNQRFSIALKPSATDTFVLKEDFVHDEYMTVSSMTPDAITAIAINRALPAAGKQQLERIAAQKRLIAETDRAIRAADQRIQSLSADQDRLRQNIASLNAISGQQEVVQRYARDLAAREQQIITLRDQAAEQRTKKSALESELNAMLEKLEF
ncbi:MAG TPA: hypothetical protein VFQ91_15195 [Bryobacteraceae bacterium]|nr:hypothetical protein [Bryobacteraceae bacterium]